MTQPPVRTGACPSCGAPVSFALASSVVAVCGYCRFAVARTDRDLRLVGKVADLVPTTPEAAIGDEGNVAGHRFRVFGRLQIDHGRGPWDEWYVALENGGWGWLARAQGRWYATSPAPYAPGSAPDYARAVAGTRLELAGQTWVVAERGRSRVLSAEGELPLPVRVGEEGRYLDLSGPAGAFATLDYGDGSEPPRLYVGRVVPAEQVRFTMRAAGPRPAHVVETARLRCPSCGAPVELFVPDRAERRTCGHCNALLDVEHGELRYLKHLEPRPVRPTIPIGARGTLRGEAVVCTGFMLRSVVEDGEWFQWTEYLLWTPAGYRWLTEDARGHFHLYRPIEIGDVVVDGHQAFVGDRRFRLHTSGDVAPAHVDHVQGEFYWRVEVGDTSRLDDYVAPPEALGIERTQDEIHAALGTWVDPHELWRAFGLSGPPPRPSGTGLAQPAPSAR
ncbi:MAG: DUF4178 domain-containing protein, partial [Myxococcales bacterium]|nr:DUF4178 domain-containing protein [Myxococcales bacterium]